MEEMRKLVDEFNDSILMKARQVKESQEVEIIDQKPLHPDQERLNDYVRTSDRPSRYSVKNLTTGDAYQSEPNRHDEMSPENPAYVGWGFGQ